MKRIITVKARPRRYRSPLRDDQSETTRTRILDALIRTMAKGVAGLSVPAVAREAGVSVPTIYRHFKTKADLLMALGPHLFEQSRLMEPPASAASRDLGAVAIELYSRAASLSPELRAALASDLASEARRRMMPERIGRIRAQLRVFFPALPARDLERLTRFLLIAASSATIRAYEEYLGLTPEAAGEDVAWVFRAIQRGVPKMPRATKEAAGR
ncbi:MAG: TetR family transcriptional regulator [Candidatus Limnocylindrales bacterium]